MKILVIFCLPLKRVSDDGVPSLPPMPPLPDDPSSPTLKADLLKWISTSLRRDWKERAKAWVNLHVGLYLYEPSYKYSICQPRCLAACTESKDLTLEEPFCVGHAISVVHGLCQEKFTAHFRPLTLLSSGIGVPLMRIHRKRHGLILRTWWVLMFPTWPSNCWESIWPSGLCHGSPRQSPLCPSACLPNLAVIIQRLLATHGTCRILMISLLWRLPLPTVLGLQLTHLLPTCVSNKTGPIRPLPKHAPGSSSGTLPAPGSSSGTLPASGSADGAKPKAGSPIHLDLQEPVRAEEVLSTGSR